MSVDLITERVERFLSMDAPEVLCISGEWGVGKTYTWRRLLSAAQNAGKIKVAQYSYVSLFGINSMDGLRHAIFANRIPTAKIGKKLSAQDWQELGRQHSSTIRNLAARIPGIGPFFDAVAPLLLQTIRDQLICIDDLERKGDGLAMRDVLGLISFLREECDCRVVLLSNIDALTNEADKKDFADQLEKVVDEFLTFAPTPAYSASIALGEAYPAIAERCVALGISNIRVIAKIKRLWDDLAPTLESFTNEVREHAAHYLVVVGWCRYGRDAPSIEFLEDRVTSAYQRRNARMGNADDESKIPATEAAWNASLESYGFYTLDELGRVLWDGVQRGYFDRDAILREAANLQDSADRQRAELAQRQAWAVFHDSFADNEQEVVDAIYNTIFANVRFVSLANLSGAMRILRELGRDELADLLLSEYVERNSDRRECFDIEGQHVFRNEIRDPKLIEVVRAKYQSFADARRPIDAALKVGEHGGSQEEYAIAARVSVDELAQTFQERSGDALRSAVKACLDSDRVINAREEERSVSEKAKEALAKIGATSRLNALRVRKYGIGSLGDGSEAESEVK